MKYARLAIILLLLVASHLALADGARAVDTGSIRVTISPSAARSYGAQWRPEIVGYGWGTWYKSGETISGFRTGPTRVQFRDIDGWRTPSEKTVTVMADQTVSTTGTYVEEPQYGSIRVTISPTAARSDGAEWRPEIVGYGWGTWYKSGETISGFRTGPTRVQFRDIDGWRTPPEKTVTVMADQTVSTTGTYVKEPQYGSIRVTIEPAAAISAGAKWRVDGGSWRTSGTSVGNLVVGNHWVEFSAVSGWQTPVGQSLSVSANQVTSTTGRYSSSPQYGSLQVFFGPDAVRQNGAWRMDGGTWRSSGATVSQVPVGNHTVTFKDVAGWRIPQMISVTISQNTLKSVSASYTEDVQTGAVRILLSPAEAVGAGAQWRLDGGGWMNSGATLSDITAGSHIVSFKEVLGWKTPAGQTVSITVGSTLQESIVYESDEICLRSADPYEKWQDWEEGPAKVNTAELRGGNASHNLSPAEIIYYSAKENDINPVLLLAKLQDEQSLLTQGEDFSNAAGDFEKRLEKAAGLGVYDSGATPKWFGFYPQLVGSSYQWHKYREQGLTFKVAYETYTTGPGKYDGFTRSGGFYEGAAATMNRVAGASYDTKPDTNGYYNDFRDVPSMTSSSFWMNVPAI